jgi:hypothetical protein
MTILLKFLRPTEPAYGQQWASFMFYLGAIFAILVQWITGASYWILYIVAGSHLIYCLLTSFFFAEYYWNRDTRLPLAVAHYDVGGMRGAVKYFYVLNIIVRAINSFLILAILLALYFNTPIPIKIQSLAIPCALAVFEVLTFTACLVCEKQLDAPWCWTIVFHLIGFVVGYPIVWTATHLADCRRSGDGQIRFGLVETAVWLGSAITISAYMIFTFFLLVNRHKYMPQPTISK